ncbi:hypothetical protein D3C74_257050 [compost metagenome]
MEDKVYYGETITRAATDDNSLETQIRQIVREELAAHEERLNISINVGSVCESVLDGLRKGSTPFPV